MLKYLRISLTALSLTACVLLIALWAQGAQDPDYDWKQIGSWRGFEIVSDRGHFTFRLVDTTGNVRPWRATISDVQNEMVLVGDEARPTFGIKWDGGTLVVDTLCYLPILLSMMLVVVPWMPGRFSLRTLLIAMTLLTVGLGIMAAVD